MMRLSLLLLLLVQEKDPGNTDPSAFVVPPDFTVRARVAASTPSVPGHLRWRYGGEGLGGNVSSGVFAENLPAGHWSEPLPLLSIAKKFPKKLFLTVTVDPATRSKQERVALKDVTLEFEFAWRGKVVKTCKEAAPDGPTVGLLIPAYRLAGGKTPDHPDFTAELGGIAAYVRGRADRLEALAEGGPLPQRYAVVTDLGGWGAGAGYGIRHADPAITEAELGTLRQLGVNALRARPPKVGAGFARAAIEHAGGFPVVRFRKGAEPPRGAGCPFGPEVARLAQAQAAAALEHLKDPVDEAWLLTVDEIGTVLAETPEGKWKHAPGCADCGRAYREWLERQGWKPSDFGKAAWSEVAPVEPAAPAELVRDPAAALAAYQTAMFGNWASARLFTPLREALSRANEEKRKDPSLKRPWLHSYALRGNTFLMQGASLDFFEYYRHADNGFVYETSNRDPRIWGWDSYLCDVGRVVSADQGLRFGVYIKPHRGAPVQRMLAAAGRNARMLYWYTYGPDYSKGDSFSERPELLELVSRAARLLGRSEEVLYGSSWARPAEIAIVNPCSSEKWIGLSGGSRAKEAAWENAKWTYTALQHAHLPVDPLDEVLLATRDLSRYKAIYVSGPHLTRAAAAKVAAWVEAGGTLYTSGGGLAWDEAQQPLRALEPVLGLKERAEPEMWYRVQPYGATALEAFDEAKRVLAQVPAGAKVDGVPLVVGREALKPATAQVVATFADGTPAITRNRFGRGQAVVAGFFPGLEYSAPLRKAGFDMSTGFEAARRAWIAGPALERTSPVVDASVPTVEGVLLRNDASGKLAVTLANWAYKAGGVIVPVRDLKVTIRGAGDASRATSAALGKALAGERSGEALVVTLPRLAEGDVLLLE